MTENTMSQMEPLQAPEKTRRRRKRSGWRIFGVVIVLMLVLGLASACAYLHTGPGGIARMVLMGVGYLKDRAYQTPPFQGKKQVNILLLGTDVDFQGHGASRTDSMKLVSVDLASPRISVLSIPRDTWVDLPDGHGHGRINEAYPLGGVQEANRLVMAKSAVSTLLSGITGNDVQIDRVIRMQVGGFINVINAIGGIDIDVEKQMDYEDPSQNLLIHLKPGLQRLDGEHAMEYVRFRHDAEGDYGRIRRQDQFMHALAARIGQPDMKSQLPRLMGPIIHMMVTDLTLNDMRALKEVTDKVGMSGIQTATLPTVPTMKGRASVVEVKEGDATVQTVNDVLRGPRPTVVVLNGSKQTGLAREVSERIDSGQYHVLTPASVEQPVPVSTIYANKQDQSAAATLGSQLGVTAIDTTSPPPPPAKAKTKDTTSTDPTARITVVLGADYHGLPEGSKQAALD